MTTIEQHEAEWAAIRAAHFPTVTDPVELLRLHSSYMIGFSAGMKWMRAAASQAISESFAAERSRSMARLADEPPGND